MNENNGTELIPILNELVDVLDKDGLRYLYDRIYRQLEKKQDKGELIGKKGIGEHAEVFNNIENNVAIGKYAHTKGGLTVAAGYASYAEGSNNISGMIHENIFEVISVNKENNSFTINNPNSKTFESDKDLIAIKINKTAGNTIHKFTIKSYDSNSNTVYINENTLLDYDYISILYDTSASHAEGFNTRALGYCSHAEGEETEALNNCAHVEGYQTQASGICSHAECQNTLASGICSHAEGYQTQAIGGFSHAEGQKCKAIGNLSHVEGYKTNASSNFSHSEGFINLSGYIGYSVFNIINVDKQNNSFTIDNPNNSLFELNDKIYLYGYWTDNIEVYTVKEYNESTNTIYINEQIIDHVYYYIFKYGTESSSSHSEGSFTKAIGADSHSEGNSTIAVGMFSHAANHATIANTRYMTAIGIYNKLTLDGFDKYNETNDLFVIGNGSSEENRSNIFRVHTTDGCFSTKAFQSTGADYAEFFLWEDENPTNEDRVGLFVTMNGEKIRLASPEDDYIVGIISGDPSVIGDVHDDQWHNMYLKDIFGRPIMEYREEPDEIISMEVPNPEYEAAMSARMNNPEMVSITKEDGSEIPPTITETHTIPGAKGNFMKVNPDYDPSQTYIPRSQRPEWGCVGMMGKIVMIDDGTCQVNGYAWSGENGVATHAPSKTKFRVMSRLDDTHIKVVIVP